MEKETIATRLKTLRLSKKATQKEFADAIGCNLTTYNRYEKGLAIIQTQDLERIYCMGCSLDWLVVGKGNMSIDDMEAAQNQASSILDISRGQVSVIDEQAKALREAAEASKKTAEALSGFAIAAQKNADIIDDQHKMLIRAVHYVDRNHDKIKGECNHG